MYYLLGLSIAAASFNSVALKKSKVTEAKDVFRFNLLGALVWCIMVLVLNKGQIHISGQILFWGAAYGVVQTLFILFKALAMSNGNVSVTTVIGNCSLVISIFVSYLVWKEPISAVDILGLLILLGAIFLCTYRTGAATGEYSKKWKYYVVPFFIFAASVGLVFKAFGKTVDAGYSNDMIFVAAVIMVISYSMACVFCSRRESTHEKAEREQMSADVRLWRNSMRQMSGHGKTECAQMSGQNEAAGQKRLTGHFLKYAVVCGALSCLYNSLNIVLAGKIDAILFFPAFNGGVIMLSAVLGLLICREKLTLKQKCGILLGIAAIILIGIF